MPPEAAFALWLLAQAQRHGTALAILRGGARLARVAALAEAMAVDTDVLALPAWDVLPYDRARPSAAAVGRRVRTLVALTRAPARPRLVLTSAAAALIRVRPPRAWTDAVLALHAGDTVDLETLRLQLADRGYHWDEHVDEPGEVALRGHAIDLFPAGDELPVRLDLDDAHRILAIQIFDPLTQRTIAPIEKVSLGPAIEHPLDPDERDAAAAALEAHAWSDPDFAPEPAPAAAAHLQRLVPVMDYLPGVAWWADPEVPDRWAAAADAIQDAYAAASAARRAAPDAPVPPHPSRLYITPAQAAAALTGAPLAAAVSDTRLLDVGFGDAIAAPARIADLVRDAQAALAASLAVVIATPAEPERVAASLARRGLQARVAANWTEATAGGAAVLRMEAAEGLRTPALLLLPIGALLRPNTSNRPAESAVDAPRCGDIIVHADHGVARLKHLRTVETDGAPEERIVLNFADDTELLIPVGELDRIWRYGSSEGRVPLDRIGGDAWRRKREETQAEIDATAARLAAAAAARAQASAPAMTPPSEPYAALARRFPYPPTRCQRAASDAILADLASGRPMDRLVCGDVGFGKTEIALRAAAATALAGWQVLIAAPTTVLARQHLDTFRARFANSGIEVEGLVRGSNTPEGRAARRRLRNGRAHIVVGTQGLASDGVRFAKLGLAVIDEEQRFGEADKTRLAAPHKLVMTATPIPRTLQSALVGLRDVSILLTPPARRQPTRTFVLPWEPDLVRDALLRERRRGGQSFIVVPRIQDLIALQAELADLVPTLRLVAAHGRMAPEALERAVLGFASGDGDVLLATNIIEAGLDIPRANLMLVVGADRFGLAQLHQLRGRVGRGARRGTAYLLTAKGRRLQLTTQRRLHAMEALSGLGAGAAVAAADLDLRGAGDLFGEEQAGHVRALGTGLYQHLLRIAVAERQGLPAPPPTPVLHTGLTGHIPEAYVPEPDLRLSLYARLAQLSEPADLLTFTEELEDRFGSRPPELESLIALHRLRLACIDQGVTRLDAGPRGTALTPLGVPQAEGLSRLAEVCSGTVRDGRVLFGLAMADPMARVTQLIEALA